MHWSTLLAAFLIALSLVAPPFPAFPAGVAAPGGAGAPGAARAADPKAAEAERRGATTRSHAESSAPPARVVVPAKAGEAVNVNTADVKDLMTLDGIGRRVAERIVEYRESHGPFKKPDDLRRVQGVGAGLFERNRERIVVK